MEWAEEPAIPIEEGNSRARSSGLEDERLFELATKHLETHSGRLLAIEALESLVRMGGVQKAYLLLMQQANKADRVEKQVQLAESWLGQWSRTNASDCWNRFFILRPEAERPRSCTVVDSRSLERRHLQLVVRAWESTCCGNRRLGDMAGGDSGPCGAFQYRAGTLLSPWPRLVMWTGKADTSRHSRLLRVGTGFSFYLRGIRRDVEERIGQLLDEHGSAGRSTIKSTVFRIAADVALWN